MAKVIPISKRRKAKPKYKYSLNEQVGALPRTTVIGDVVKHLEAYGISRNEFYADRKIPFGAKSSIPSDRLFIYARVFDCNVEDLLNHDIPQAESIRQKRLKVKTSLR